MILKESLPEEGAFSININVNSKTSIRSYLLIAIFPAVVVLVCQTKDRVANPDLKRPPLEHLSL